MNRTGSQSGKYQPLDRRLYDFIEHFATLKIPVRIEYLSNAGVSITVIDQLITTETTPKKEEYLILRNGQRVRMDRLIQIEDISFD